MAITVKPSGISTSGPAYLTDEPFATAGAIIFVNSATGSNSNTGLIEELPKANVFGTSGTNAYQAATTATSATIVVASGHTETISGAWDGSAGKTWSSTQIRVVGKGSGTSRPRFTAGVASPITISGAMTKFENCYFAASTSAPTARITVGAALGVMFKDCQFDCGSNDTGDCILVSSSSANSLLLDGCTFTSTSSSAARAFKISAAASDLKLVGCTFDGGSFGWASDAVTLAAAVVGFELTEMTLSNYSDLNISTTGAKGRISGLTVDATSSWQWNP